MKLRAHQSSEGRPPTERASERGARQKAWFRTIRAEFDDDSGAEEAVLREALRQHLPEVHHARVELLVDLRGQESGNRLAPRERGACRRPSGCLRVGRRGPTVATLAGRASRARLERLDL